MEDNRFDRADNRPFETMLSRFGSRFTINPQVSEGRFRISPIGTYHWGSRTLKVSVTAGGETRELPFGGKPFAQVHQSLRMTSIDYRATDPGFALDCELSFIAPFYPQDKDFCSVPAMYVLLWMHNKAKERVTAKFSLSLGDDGIPVNTNSYTARVYEDDYAGEAGSYRGHVATGFLGPESVDVPPGGERVLWGVLAGYVSEPVLNVKGVPHTFGYTKRFKDVQGVLSYAASHRERDLRKNELFESTVFDSNLSAEVKELIALGFQSFAANSWMTESDAGEEWFSVWEGNCGYHSTIDVEYNQSPFYLQYWPGLLATLFDEWASCKTDPGFMEHDMGQWQNVRRAEYGHPMKVEENTNFLLMLASYWKTTGDRVPVMKHYPLARELAEFLFACDTTGNGFADQGVENTLDSGSFVVELSKEQVYLAVKCIASYLMLAEIAREMNDAEFADRLKAQAEKTQKTLDSQAWFGDHYAVCLDETVRGWNTYGMMADNGLLFPLRAGMEIPLRIDRIAFNLIRSLQETTRPDSQRMTAVDNNGWFSQQMFRDMVAAYLGIDLSASWSSYLAYEKRVNREDSNCFKDAWPPGIATLNYYPRGAAAAGMLQSAGGIVIDAQAKAVIAAPPTKPVRLPLTMLADWKTGNIPWLHVSDDGKASVTGASLPPGWKLETKETPPARELTARPPQIVGGAPEFCLFWGKGEVSGRHGYWSAEEMFEGKPFEVRVWFRAGKEAVRDLGVAVTTAPGIELRPMDDEVFSTLDPGEMLQYVYSVRILPEYNWDGGPAIFANCCVRTEDTSVCLPERTLVFSRDPRKKYQQGDVRRQEAGYRPDA